MKLAQRAHDLVRLFLAAAPLLLTPAPCLAYSAGPPQLEIAGEVDAVVATASAEADRSAPFADMRLRLSAEHIRDDGIRLGVQFEWLGRADSGRRGLSRGLGECPPGFDDCGEIAGLAPAGLFTGLHATPLPGPAGPRAGVEMAHVFIRAPLWEAYLGYGPGAAMLETRPLPGALRVMRADGPLTDPSGRAIVSTANTLSAHAPKLTVRSRRLAGLRLAASFTPDGDVCGVTVCRLVPLDGVLAAASPSDITEIAASFDHRFAAIGTRWSAYLTAAHGHADGRFAADFRDPWAVSAGVQMARGAWAAGVAGLTSNDGLTGVRYQAGAASISYELDDWMFSAEIGQARSSLVHARGWSGLLAASRYFDSGFILGFGLSHTDVDVAAPGAAIRLRENRAGTQAFIESGLRF